MWKVSLFTIIFGLLLSLALAQSPDDGLLLIMIITMNYLIPFLIYLNCSENLEDDSDFEDDMLLTDEQKELLFSENSIYSGNFWPRYKWHDGRVPYFLTPEHDQHQVNHIKSSMKYIESVSCVYFVDRTSEHDTPEEDYIQFEVNCRLQYFFY